MLNIDKTTPVWQISVGELSEIIKRIINDNKENNESDIFSSSNNNIPPRNYVYGIDGLAKLLGCSKTTAQRLKSKGVFSGAIKQNGRTIIIDSELALQKFEEYQNE